MPEQESQSPGLKIYRNEVIQKTNKFPLPRLLKVTAAILVIVLLASGGSLVGASYLTTKAPLVSAGFQRKVDYLIAGVPIVPKTPKQILTKAFQDSQKIETSKQNFDFSVKSGDKSLGSLSVESQVNAKNLDNIALSAHIKGESILGDLGSKTDLSLVEIGNSLYFKFDQAPSVSSITKITGSKVTYNLSVLQGKWFNLDVAQAESSLGMRVLGNKEVKRDVNKKAEELFTFLEKNGIFKKIKMLPSEKLAVGESYHLALPVDAATLAKISQELMPGTKVDESEVTREIKNFNLEMWVDQKSFSIVKFTANLEINNLGSSSSLSAGQLQTAKISTAYELSAINQEIKIEPPKEVTKLQSILNLFFLIQTGSLMPTSIEGILGVSSNPAEFGSNVLFLERLIHVVMLFPSAI